MQMFGEHGARWEIEEQGFKKGGEGAIHNIIGYDSLVAKIYKDGALNDIRREKLVYMSSLYSPDLNQIAWPQDVLRDQYGNVKGFVMRKFNTTEDMADLLDGTGSGNEKQINWKQRVVVALNLADLVKEIHAMGQVIGDMNPKNFGVDMNSGFVCAFDADSFHIKNQGSGKWYPCLVLDEHYIAPELQEKLQQGARVDSFRPQDTFTVSTDLFALGVLIFQLLFMGVHPFTAAREKCRGSSVVVHRRETNIYNRMCPFFNPAPNITVPVYAPPLWTVPGYMQQLFKRAFLENDRPTAKEWRAALGAMLMKLEQCPRGHFYENYDSGSKCPWCFMEDRKKAGEQKKEEVKRTQQGQNNGQGSQNNQRSPGRQAGGTSTVGGTSAVGGTTATGGANAASSTANRQFKLVDRKTIQKGMKKPGGDGSSQLTPVVVTVKTKEAETEHNVKTPWGEVVVPAGLDEHEMLLYQSSDGKDLYIQHNVDTPFVFTWICMIALGIYLANKTGQFISFIGGGFIGSFLGAILDGILSGPIIISKYRKRMGIQKK